MTDGRTIGEQTQASVGDDVVQAGGQPPGWIAALVAEYGRVVSGKPGHMPKIDVAGRDLPGRDLEQYEAWLAEAHGFLRTAIGDDLTLGHAAEWVLDNYYIVRQALRQILEDLPPGYYRRLPKLADGPMAGFPRIYAMTCAIIARQRYLLDVADLQDALIEIQGAVPLAMGELWAAPLFLRYALIEALARALAEIIRPARAAQLPPAAPPFSADLRQAPASGTPDEAVANIILSLRAIAEQDWNDFFESVSGTERILRQDPAEVYEAMDFETRDRYRKEIEALAFALGQPEHKVAAAALELARRGAAEKGGGTDRQAHVGEYLLGDGRAAWEACLGYRPGPREAIRRLAVRHTTALYLGSITVLTLFFSWVAWLALGGAEGYRPDSFWGWVAALALVPAVWVAAATVAVEWVNWAVTMWTAPRVLPKLELKRGIPETLRTMVVIPALLTDGEEITALVRQLEMHYLRNAEPGLLLALLTDFRDADSETLPEDEALLQQAAAEIAALNAHYARGWSDEVQADGGPAVEACPHTAGPFFLFHRRRLWNAAEGVWMGWERKRGKLHELNMLLRGSDDLSFIALEGNMGTCSEAQWRALLHSVQFVITLDADTILPSGAARRLVGTLAHPLNRAEFHTRRNRVRSGYTVLQPRVDIQWRSVTHSRFTRIFAGDVGLDLYTRAVSDVYQDLFGEGSYVGKGIYDVDAFVRSTEGRIPENAVLSHDLLEGSMGRVGLVTDITMIEDYPSSYFLQVMRQRRWIRGDWQILPWLFRPWLDAPAHAARAWLSTISRWKILDNLRRSLVAPALLLVFSLGMARWPERADLWAAIVLLSLGMPLFTATLRGIWRVACGDRFGAAFRSWGDGLARFVLAVAFVPYEAYVALDAILTTLYRLAISHRDLLQWTTAAHSARLLGSPARRTLAWQKMGLFSFLSLGLLASIWSRPPAGGTANWASLAWSAPILLLWVLSPLIAWWINRPLTQRVAPLTEAQALHLRRLSRRTWAFFERFVGPEDHWLPPDHFQESPVGIVAHQTSPTNIGLLLTSTLAAYDLGYLDQLELATRLSTTLDALDQLEHYRGHLLNWYDTVTLQPLRPRYVSTVDSGNLVACLIVTTQACRAMSSAPVFRRQLWQGYLDALANLSAALADVREAKLEREAGAIGRRLAALQGEIAAAQDDPRQWHDLFVRASGPLWRDIAERLAHLVVAGSTILGAERLHELHEIIAPIEKQHLTMLRAFAELMPWVPLLADRPAVLREPSLSAPLAALLAELGPGPTLAHVQAGATAARAHIPSLRRAVLASESHQAALEWLETLDQALERAGQNAAALMAQFDGVAERAAARVNATDFGFLYDRQRHAFHIGLNLEADRLDNNYYDLLASEARIASIIAIAKGDVPLSHWLHLGRPLTRVKGVSTLLSWSGTMFEYLMPPLFLRSLPGTLLADSARGAVLQQIAYGKMEGVPWGISESGFYHFDTSRNYQYRAFGAPGLGFKRGLADDLVIAPYASLMAIAQAPQAVADNLQALTARYMLGPYGCYEAIDFTPTRMPLGQVSAVVSEYMAHHQGMILMAMANYFERDVMVRRMHSDARIQGVELLLHEQVPWDAPLQNPAADDARPVQRPEISPTYVPPWRVPVHTPIPQLHVLSNGSYRALLSNGGGGASSWNEVDLTRWQPDGTLDPWGTWVYVQDAEARDQIWSAAPQPLSSRTADVRVMFYTHMVSYHRTHGDVVSTLEVTVPPEDAVEVRRLELRNAGEVTRRLRVASYGEVALAPSGGDARHPAFSKLFIESEFVPELSLLIFRRRPRSSKEKPVFMGHMLVWADPNDDGAVRYETDRARFLGRHGDPRRPAALAGDDFMSGTTGATLDPIFSLGGEIAIEPHQSVRLAYVTLAAASRDDLLALAGRYRGDTAVTRAFQESELATQSWLSSHEMGASELQAVLRILSALTYPNPHTRAAPEIIAANQLGQAGLWRFGISGDYPLLLAEVRSPAEADLVREVLRAHRYLRSSGLMVDVVLLNLEQTDYGADLHGMLYRLVNRVNYAQWLNQRGGVFILNADQMSAEERTLLRTAARVALHGERGDLDEQLPGYAALVIHLPDLIPTRQPDSPETAAQETALPAGEALQFANGYGGFGADGREYVIDLPAGRATPAPWANVIGYPEFGFMVSEVGSQCTWAGNSGENRLTPWSNDPVRDPTGEALYLRDEETGHVWSPTPQPAGDAGGYRVRHGAGYTTFEHHSYGLEQRLTLYASPDDPVKIVRLQLRNTRGHTRRITATQYVEWVLGTLRADTAAFIVPQYDPDAGCLLATNPYSPDFGTRVAFLAASRPIHGATADRIEFLGRQGSYARPAALRRMGLEMRVTPGEDPCAALQVHLDLPPGERQEIHFVLGQGRDRDHALELAGRYRQPEVAEAAWRRTHEFWDALLGAVQVHTPDPALDLMLNRWLLYQALSCRIWGRSAFYQSSGAFGFRDQLQDVLAVLPVAPAIARAQLLEAASHQFEEGDAMHWWHPPAGRGVRTRISDDLLWLPYVAARYVAATGDAGILDEGVPFRQAEPLHDDEEERYSQYPLAAETHSLLEHCRRAIERAATQGAHGLPLMGGGDWNDGMNRVGEKGRGESVWLAWFECDVLRSFADLCAARGDVAAAERYRQRADDYAAAVERTAWDGGWYRRAYYDDGTPLGSAENDECQIDAIAQSWSVLSGAGDAVRSRQAMAAVGERLVRAQERMILLFTPPFDRTAHDPGYIKGYLPGIRENGGQYTHAAIWTAWALAELGQGSAAGELLRLLNPVLQADTPEKAQVYRVEPYVVCADIYSVPPHLRRGGWTWYTGSAAWLYRFGLEGVLGLHKRGAFLEIDPVIPAAWAGFDLTYRHGGAVYHIHLRNPEGCERGVRRMTLDGAPLPEARIPLHDDGGEHKVEVIMGAAQQGLAT